MNQSLSRAFRLAVALAIAVATLPALAQERGRGGRDARPDERSQPRKVETTRRDGDDAERRRAATPERSAQRPQRAGPAQRPPQAQGQAGPRRNAANRGQAAERPAAPASRPATVVQRQGATRREEPRRDARVRVQSGPDTSTPTAARPPAQAAARESRQAPRPAGRTPTTAPRQAAGNAPPRQRVERPAQSRPQPAGPQPARVQRRDDREVDRRQAQDRGRIERAQAQARIEAERRRAEQFHRERERQRQLAERRGAERARALQQQRRMAQYRYEREYQARLREQERRWRGTRWNYDRDPYYWTPASYRYSYGGRWYETNRYGAELMREAVQRGYREGLHAGRADRQDGWRYDVRGSYGYRDASYGYHGHYISYDQYAYYFRQGFERGYEDGYHGSHRHGGRDARGELTVLAVVLATILGLQALN